MFLIIASSSSALAQPAGSTETPPSGGSITVSGIISMQPGSSDYSTGSSHLNKGLGGAVPGIAIAAGAAHSRGATVDFELSTTWPISESLTSGPAGRRTSFEAKHTDTLLSLLVGYRSRNTRQWVEYKGGGTLIFGRPSKGGEPIDDRDVAGKFAVTGGLDWVKRTHGNRMIVVGAKYSYAFRGPWKSELYLGEHMVRAGVGIRWGL